MLYSPNLELVDKDSWLRHVSTDFLDFISKRYERNCTVGYCSWRPIFEAALPSYHAFFLSRVFGWHAHRCRCVHEIDATHRIQSEVTFMHWTIWHL